MSKEQTTQISFRIPVKVLEQLDELCKSYGIKRSEFFINSVVSEYDKVQGNPKLKELIEQMKNISEKMKELSVQEPGGE